MIVLVHSWIAFDKAKEIIDYLVENGLIDKNRKDFSDITKLIRGKIQIILEE